ncbi:serine/threonine protein kinase [Aphanizomenon flos-aquae FACHB-1416]|uniref:serine/threonine protein kinase n=1 Tax=Aphanizomenon flos-aquae TaxID=1176 RepID=UPI00168094F4|nr:serine/threonine-protein kinase [Aphanizomenon flos-aquae]MBD2392014.1 serine/threonine protein kinase [Aphanizomenon flos-aquae FACHB-1171]MBD2557711.1 serine/threonine protein kinase [Aphanizomenon flos-aquae FACHB-1290]MBD2658570.1 serine/threonine protein kinase [Aphanizomenon flos-aquae FACHB-1265]MBD2675000.1 serine/threonine protein kinase [Aphanizomenon flos-aquae FACHB-1416]MBD2698445.1 serine/threonine protein kinase [Aphanizomenon flos-aquae FACHB-1287]
MEVETILVNRYEICQQLSKKAARQTFLAKDLHTQQLVIIKTLQLGQEFQWDDLKLFEREAKTLQNLNHPGIPKYLDYFESEIDNIKSFFLIQTYIDAPSLETVIRNGRKFSEVEVIELAESFLNILTYLHEQIPPIIHRDIKPSNILLTNRSGNSIGNLYLVDFGSVQTVASKDSGTITIVGSYGYMPFEQFSGQTTIASDLYSFGMTLIYLMTGVHPAELPQVNGRVQFKNIAINNKLIRWLEKMTHPFADQRFDSAKVAIAELKSKNESHSDDSHLRPVGSKVKLYRDQNKLEIVFEKKRKKQITTVIVIFLFFGMIFAGGAIILALLMIGILIKVIPIIINIINPNLNASTFYKIISINRNSTIRIGLGFADDISEPKQWQNSSFINLLVYNAGYTFDNYLNDRGSVVNQTVTIQPKLFMYSEHGIEYEVGDDEYQLSQGELLWLGQEISDFLGIEMKVIYPTPKVPPEISCGGGC